MDQNSLLQQLAFLKEIDRLKSVLRQSPLLDRSRKENSAEHSWHLAVYAWLLADTADESVNISRVIKMLLVHDIVEVDCGDTPIHSAASGEEQAIMEGKAAERLFGLLPEHQAVELKSLWQEFEQAESVDARFAKAIDRFQPLLTNIFTGGGTWNENNVQYEQVLSRYGPVIRKGAPALWDIAEKWINKHYGRS